MEKTNKQGTVTIDRISLTKALAHKRALTILQSRGFIFSENEMFKSFSKNGINEYTEESQFLYDKWFPYYLSEICKHEVNPD